MSLRFNDFPSNQQVCLESVLELKSLSKRLGQIWAI